MNPIRSSSRVPHLSLHNLRRAVLTASLASVLSITASAAEFTFQYYQFKPTAIRNNGTGIQVSEFTFSRGGTLLNLNNRNGSGVNSVAVTASSAGQGTTGNEDPWRIVDGQPLVSGGSPATKWYRGNPLADGNELIFNFGAPVTVDSYNFCTGGDDTTYSRTPVSWKLSGSNDGTTWTLLDVRVNAVPLPVTNLTYQAGYDIPSDVPPVIGSFAVHNTPLPGSSAIVLNGKSVTLDWTSSYASLVQLTDPVATNTVAASGSMVVTPPSNSTSAYTLAASKAGSNTATATATVRAVAGGSKTYRYVRYSITKRQGGTGSNLVQLSEFEFYNGDATVAANKVTIAGATNPGGNDINGSQGPGFLYDGSFTTKWLDANNKPVIFDFGETPKTFDRYLFVTGNDAVDRDPIQWKLEGSNDQSRWDLIENVDFDYPTPVARSASSLSIPLPGPSLPPQIEFFTGNTASLITGDALTLSWSTQAAKTVTLAPYTGAALPLYGSVVVHPTEDTTYTLTADPGPGGTPTTATFTVFLIPDPGVNNVSYSNFATAGAELVSQGSATITPPDSTLPGRLRLTAEQQGQSGSAWFLKKLAVTGGFEATFGMSLNQEHPNNYVPADGLAFVVQNSAAGTGEGGTGENGVPQNALNICFHTFGFAADPASVVEVRSGTTVLARTVTYQKPGIQLYGIPGVDDAGKPIATGGFPYTLGSLAKDPPYKIRVVYTPHDLDVYLDGIAILQNVDVDLQDIGATDSSGKSYFGFTARTGGNVQNSDITDWHVKLGNFSAPQPFGMVKTLFRYTPGISKPTSVDLVWNAPAGIYYDTVSSTDLATWNVISVDLGVDGQIGVNVDISFLLPDAPSAFFRVQKEPVE